MALRFLIWPQNVGNVVEHVKAAVMGNAKQVA